MLRARRIMVAIRRIVGKEENSSGVCINKAVIRIRTEKVMETASAMSSIIEGMGRMSMTRMAMTPRARPMSP